MQKKLIAVAVAGLMSGAAFAQSNVTIYGAVDLGYLNASTDNATAANQKSKTGIDSGLLAGSRLGFRGTEDLGGGLTANFVIETTLNSDVSNQFNAGDRTSTLSLSSKSWGTVVAGRMTHLTNQHYGRYTVLNGTAFDPTRQAGRAANTFNTAAATENTDFYGWDNEMHVGTRVSNAVAYVSPNMGGFTAAAAYSFVNERKDVDGDQKRGAWNLSADYAAGPLSVGAAYIKASNSNTGGVSDNNGDKQWNLGAKYNFGFADLRVGYGKQKNNVVDSNSAKMWTIGAVAPVSAVGNVHFAYAKSKRDTGATAGSRQMGGKSWALAYTHAMSKRTTAYAGYGTADNRTNATGNFYGLGMEADKKAKAFAAGLRHTF